MRRLKELLGKSSARENSAHGNLVVPSAMTILPFYLTKCLLHVLMVLCVGASTSNGAGGQVVKKAP